MTVFHFRLLWARPNRTGTRWCNQLTLRLQTRTACICVPSVPALSSQLTELFLLHMKLLHSAASPKIYNLSAWVLKRDRATFGCGRAPRVLSIGIVLAANRRQGGNPADSNQRLITIPCQSALSIDNVQLQGAEAFTDPLSV